MNSSIQYVFSVLFAGLLIFISGCEKYDYSQTEIKDDTIIVSGSSTLYPVTSEAAHRFLRKNPDVSISITQTGTTAGLQKFCAGKIDIINASRPISGEEKASCAANGVDFITLPVATDTIAVVTSLENNWLKQITMDELRTVWSPESEGKIMTWQDVNPAWPDEKIELFGRNSNSGTFDYFTTQVMGESGKTRKDYKSFSTDQPLAEAVAKSKNGIGYLGIGAYHRNWQELKPLAIDFGGGAVYPCIETANDGSYQPLTRQLSLYVNKASLSEKPGLKPFLNHYFAHLKNWIAFTGYLPLSTEQYQNNISQLQ
jgi:phosphate transport system substrate-binding protein